MYSIVIPSYRRSQKLKNETLNTLNRFEVEKNIIHIFVVEEEYDEYKSLLPEYKIIIGEKGIINQKRFIENYFKENDLLLFLDVNIKIVTMWVFLYLYLLESMKVVIL